MATRVAVVTGSNKGIGFGVVRTLCKQFDGDVILTARDEGRGKAAVQALEKEHLRPKFHPLDIEDHKSVVTLASFIKENYGGLDALVNNAAIAYKPYTTAPFSEQAEVTTRINFFATLDVCNVLFPLLRPHARVANVSSLVSKQCLPKCSDELQTRFVDPDISMEEIKSLMEQFILSGKEERVEAEGFVENAYGMSKMGVTVMSIIQQRELDRQGSDDILVNACCPGFVDTDMTDHEGYLTIDQGAETPVYCATLPRNIHSPRGKFICEKQINPWEK